MKEIFESIKKYNLWSGQDINSGFIRQAYLEKLSQYIDNRLIKILTGQRRTGKSFLLRQIIKYLIGKGIDSRNILYINKEIIHFDKLNNYLQLSELIEIYKEELKPKGKIYLFIDEIQQIEGWEKAVNSYSQDFTEHFEIFITGSNSTMLAGELSTLLSGRYIEFNIYPFSFDEYTLYYKLEKNRENLLSYLLSGGLPELLHLGTDEIKIHYINSLKDTIILKDIIQKYKLKEGNLLERLFLFFINNSSNLFSVNSITSTLRHNKIEISNNTVSNYIEYLKQCYLIHESSRYDIRGKEIISGSKKYYLNDLSYRNYLFSGFDKAPGKLLENYVYLNFRQKGYNVYCGQIRHKEIDFVIEKNNDTKYIQVAWQLTSEETIHREFGNLEIIPDNYEKMVISMDELPMGNYNGIRHIQAWEI